MARQDDLEAEQQAFAASVIRREAEGFARLHDVDAFPVSLECLTPGDLSRRLSALAAMLMQDFRSHSESRKMKFQHDALTAQCIIPKRSNPIIDDIDSVLAEHYGFTDEELDFIINYDIKYRMGLSGENGEDECLTRTAIRIERTAEFDGFGGAKD